jgi:hypothetical protein
MIKVAARVEEVWVELSQVVRVAENSRVAAVAVAQQLLLAH